MKNYEITYLITEEGTKEIQNWLISNIQEKDGLLEGERQPLLKKLAYPVKGRGQAFLAVVVFRLSPEKLPDLEKEIKEHSQILRYLLLSKEKEPRTAKRQRPELAKKEMEKTEKEAKAELEEIENKLEEILTEDQQKNSLPKSIYKGAGSEL